MKRGYDTCALPSCQRELRKRLAVKEVSSDLPGTRFYHIACHEVWKRQQRLGIR